MPSSAPRPCCAPACGGIAVSRGYCEEHKAPVRVRKAQDDRRGTAHQRGYGSDWRRLSRRYRAENPFCELCESRGLLVAVQLVDHVIPVDVRPDLRMYEENLCGLCRPCHFRKTSEDEERYGPAGARKASEPSQGYVFDKNGAQVSS